MSDLFMRSAQLIIGNNEWWFPDIYMQYEIDFDYDQIPDTGTIYIYNLSKDSRNKIKAKHNISFNAGYEGDIGNIFSGVITDVYSYREGTDRITRIKGLNVTNQYLDSKIAKNYNAGVTSEYLVNDILKQIGLIPNVINLGKNTIYQRGFSAFGKTVDVLKRVVKDAGSRIVIKNTSINILPANTGIETGFLLNPETGLLSVNKIDNIDSLAQYRIKMLLNHAVNSRSLLQIDSDELKATVLVIEGSHINWETTAEVRVL